MHRDRDSDDGNHHSSPNFRTHDQSSDADGTRAKGSQTGGRADCLLGWESEEGTQPSPQSMLLLRLSTQARAQHSKRAGDPFARVGVGDSLTFGDLAELQAIQVAQHQGAAVRLLQSQDLIRQAAL